MARIQKFLTLQWNNRFSLGMALIFFSFVAFVIFTGEPITRSSFTTLVLIGCLF